MADILCSRSSNRSGANPVNIRVLELIQTGCAVLIIGYMLYVTFYDAQDLPFIRNKLDKMDSQSAPAKPTPASLP